MLVTEKLKKFYTLEFKEFIDELKKQKVKLSPKEQMDLMSLFEEKKKELLALSQTIQKEEDEMDATVYQLYGLTEEEIHLVEESL